MKRVNETINRYENTIKNEKLNINNQLIKIDKYEAIIEIISQTEKRKLIQKYKQKIEKCELIIIKSLKKIQYNKKILTTINEKNNIIRRGEDCA